jgi:hypothetical protein
MSTSKFTLIAAGVLLGTLTACGGGSTASEPADDTIATPTAQATQAPAPPPTPEPPAETVGQKNAVQKAESYLSFSGFSAKGLAEQLAYEGFAQPDIDYAIAKVAPDWNAQAALKAKSYMEMGGFSAQSLSEQLAYEGFTPEQIAAGLAAVGY